MNVHVLDKCRETLIPTGQDQECTSSKYLLWCEDCLWDSLCKFKLVLWRSHICQIIEIPVTFPVAVIFALVFKNCFVFLKLAPSKIIWIYQTFLISIAELYVNSHAPLYHVYLCGSRACTVVSLLDWGFSMSVIFEELELIPGIRLGGSSLTCKETPRICRGWNVMQGSKCH